MRSSLAIRLSQPGITFRRLPVRGRVSLGFVALMVLVAVFAGLLARYNPLTSGVPAQPPSPEHWFGTDRLGRDVFARLVYGSRDSLAIGFGSTLLALTAAAVLGGLAATSGKAVDELIMRLLDVVMAFPGISLAAVLVTVFGKGLIVLICAIAFLYTPPLARVVRANVLSQYGEDYVSAEKIIGAPRSHILLRHVAINCAAPILVFCTVIVADAIVFEASLSFIGAGVQDPNPSWGNVISYGKALVLSGGWWATFFPGLLILLNVLALNVLAEGVSDAWAAPSVRSTDVAPSAVARRADPPVDPPTVDPLAELKAAALRLGQRNRRMPSGPALLQVSNLTVTFPDRHRGVAVVDHVSFDVRPGEVLGLVGESGCGKSLTSLAIMGLQPRGAQLGGQILFDGRDLLTLDHKARRQLMGRQMAMIYQDALSSLNPAMTVKAQLKQLTSRGRTRTPAELLELVGLDPRRTLSSYPHELSGGQRQRVLIAMALSRNPKLIVADEPTTALDVTVQSQIMQLLLRLRNELGFALILVSHDLALISDVTDRVIVMYGGQVAECGSTVELLGSPEHHYARGLLSAVLSLEAAHTRLSQIPGVVPAPSAFPPGCRFADRCLAATEVCDTTRPQLSGDPHRHAYACHHPGGSPATLTVTGAAGPPS